MRTVMLASAMLVLVAGTAMAQSQVIFELEVGGDNGGVGCSGTGIPFTSGQTADGLVIAAGDQLTWAARLSASGQQVGGNSAGTLCRGVANFVCTLELRDSGNNLVNAAFYSSANDGVGGCPDSAAAFAIGVNPFGLGPARVIDPLQTGDFTGGVHMDVHTYPTVETGTMLGVGAGYHNWNRTGGGATMCIAGVGQVAGDPGDPTAGVLGVGPFVEGQIDTTGLPAGDYTLTLIPGSGINVLRGDLNLGANQEAFADAADSTTGDAITFTIGGGCAPTALSWESIVDHGSAGILPIALNAAAALATTEPRSLPSDGGAGSAMTIEVDFDSDITGCVLGNAAVSGGATVGSQTVINGGSTLEIVLNGVADQACYAIDLSAAIDGIVGDADCLVATLNGDTNDDQCVTSLDRAQVKAGSGLPVAPNPRVDVNADGIISSLDRALVKATSGNCVTCP